VTPLLRSTVAHTVYVPGGSMLPTVQVGDLLAVAAGQPRPLRGGVVEIEPPAGSQGRDKLLKRIVAIGGDTVELRDGALWVNGAAVPRTPTPGECRDLARHPDGWHEEPCLDFTETLDGREYHTHCTPGRECGSLAPLQVPADQVWLAGDRRDRSADSRVFGPVAVSSIRGEARWVILSWGPRGLRWERIGLELR
jgi:signal peptidase I